MENLSNRENDRYEELERGIVNRFNTMVTSNTPVFRTDVNPDQLWDAYLNNIVEVGRQHYNCNCCKYFIKRYGSLVIIKEDGTKESVLWGKDVPPFFQKSINAMIQLVNKSKIVCEFKSDVRNLGNAKTGYWTHLHAVLPISKVNNSRVKTAGQLMAESREDYRLLSSALLKYSIETINKAVALVESDTIYRADRLKERLKWLKGISENIQKTNSKDVRKNIKWINLATAPSEFAHIESSMLGTLLNDIQEGYSFDVIKAKFESKMDSSNFMRSKSAPTEGAIVQAEKVIEKLGLDLRRRYATLEEIPEFIWKPKQLSFKPLATLSKQGVFSGITPKGQETVKVQDISLPVSVMTWDKFKRTLLPTAESVEVKVENADRLMALVTACDSNAENILQWDNPFSWYYHGGVDAEMKRRVESAGGRYENNKIRCTLMWEGYTDLDIHCITPSGSHIHYTRGERDYDGGCLDVDMNGIDTHSAKPVENIRFADKAYSGHYKFYVHNYTERGSEYATPFKVELEVDGKIYTYEGSPLAHREKVVVFEFDYVEGRPVVGLNGNKVVNAQNLEDWSISDDFIKVNGITTSPNLWGNSNIEHCGNHVFFILDGCKDVSEGKGRGFFNEMLKSELREIRKTLEAYTSITPIEQSEYASACGVGFNNQSDWDLLLRVRVNGTTRLIKIDRWD